MRNKLAWLIFLLGLSFFGAGILVKPTPVKSPTKATISSSITPTAQVTQPPEVEIATSSAQVTRVVDGDTIKVSVGGKEETVRLIGINTPETVDPRKPVECFGPQASEEAKKILTGQSINLESDSSQDSRDKYGRLLDYVFLADGTNFDLFMIRQGFAREYTYKYPYKYQQEFKLAQQQAMNEKLGLWSACANGL